MKNKVIKLKIKSPIGWVYFNDWKELKFITSDCIGYFTRIRRSYESKPITKIKYMIPGKNKNEFTLIFQESWFNKGDILETQDKLKYKVVKVYKYNWYRKLRNFLGLSFKSSKCIKVKECGK